MSTQHLKVHALTGNTDHDVTGLASGQLVYIKDSVDGVQSTGLYTNGSGGLTASTITATAISGGTIYSANTDLYSIFQKIGTDVQTAVQPGSNIVTGGTLSVPTVSLTASPSIDALSVSGAASFTGTILSGGTNIYNLFSQGSGTTNTIPVWSGTRTLGNSPITFNMGAVSVSAPLAVIGGNAIISGSTDLYNIFAQPGEIVNNVNAGSNIVTGGTSTSPTLNLTASPSINNLTFSGTAIGGAVQAAAGTLTSLSATTLSGGTILSGSTDLYTLFTQGSGTVGTLPLWTGTKTVGNSFITQTGTGVTVNSSIQIYGNVDILGTATTFNTTTVQSSDNNITMNLSGSHVSALYGGITVLSGRPDNTSSTWTIDSNGAWSANTGIYASAITVNGGAIISGSTDLYNIFAQPSQVVNNVNAGSNIVTGGTATSPTINLTASPLVNNLTFSGTAIGGTVQAAAGTFTSLSATTLSGGTILSGSTNLYSIFQQIGTDTQTAVQAGSNITTGGTQAVPIISLATSPSVNNLTFSGTAIGGALQAAAGTFTSISGGTISGGTIFSGSTPLSTIITSLSGTSGNLISASTGSNSIIANNGSGNLASGSFALAIGSNNRATALKSVALGGEYARAQGLHSSAIGGQANLANGDKTFVGGGNSSIANGISSFIGGGNNNITNGDDSNVSGGRFNTTDGTRSFIGGGRGNLATGDYSAIVGGRYNTITAGGTRSFIGGGRGHSVQAGYSSIVGGRQNTASGAYSSVVGGSGNTASGIRSVVIGGQLINGSANDTVYMPNARLAETTGTKIYSAGTDLYNIFQQAGTDVQTAVQAGSNITTGGTASVPIISLVSSPSINGLSVSGTGNFTGVIQSGSTNLSDIFTQGSGTVNTIPLWNGTKNLGNSIITQTGTGVTVNGSIYIYGNVDIIGTATTINTQTVQTLDNNILLNYSGTSSSAVGGGITVLSGNTDGSAASITLTPGRSWSTAQSIITTGGIQTSAVTVTTGAITSGGTNLYNIFAQPSQVVNNVQAGSNVVTGGTAISPIINLTASPSVNNLTFSGTAIGGAVQATAGTFTSLSATTLSGGTILSGSTNLYSIFQQIGTDTQTAVQAGSNITTGGTASVPIISLAASPFVNNFTASGTTSLQGTSGTTIHANEFFDMVPYTGANPSAPANNNFWFHSGATGIITLNYRVGGSTKSVELS